MRIKEIGSRCPLLLTCVWMLHCALFADNWCDESYVSLIYVSVRTVFHVFTMPTGMQGDSDEWSVSLLKHSPNLAVICLLHSRRQLYTAVYLIMFPSFEN